LRKQQPTRERNQESDVDKDVGQSAVLPCKRLGDRLTHSFAHDQIGCAGHGPLQEPTKADHGQALEHSEDGSPNSESLNKNQTSPSSLGNDSRPNQTSHNESCRRTGIEETVPKGELVVIPVEEHLVNATELGVLGHRKGLLHGRDAIGESVHLQETFVRDKLRIACDRIILVP